MKVYLVIDDWKREEEHEITVVGVFQNREDAEITLADQIKEIREAPNATEFDTVEEREGDYYEAWNDGYYSDAYDHIYIEEQEVK